MPPMELPDASLSHDSESLRVLPSEITYEILLQLPVKSLLKMRCVSKSWFSLISCPQFIKTHLKFSTQNQDFPCLFYGSRENSLTLNTCSLYEIMHQEESPPIPIPVQLDFPCNGVVGWCEGLFCIFNQFWNLFLWNPSIRKLKKLPFSGLDPRCGQSSSYGFGYVDCQDDYKVVDVKGSSHGDGFVNVFKIYSLRSNSWKRIQDYPDIAFWIYPGKFVNGRLYWIVGHVSDESDSDETDTNDSRFILSLNLVDETFKNVALPDLVDASLNWDIGSLGGNLCVPYTCDLVQMDVWVMKVYGFVESWTKVASIPFPTIINDWVSPIFISQNDEILLQYDSGLLVYNSTHNTFKHSEIQFHQGCGFRFNLYIESLVSPSFLTSYGSTSEG